MKLTEHFTLEELTASNTAKAKHIDNNPPEDIVANLKALCENVLEPLRNIYGKPMQISSGYRSPALNKAVGGASTSQHCKGMAADLDCGSVSANKALWNIVHEHKLDFDQCIDESNYSWVHISYRPDGTNRHQSLRMVKKNGKSTYVNA